MATNEQAYAAMQKYGISYQQATAMVDISNPVAMTAPATMNAAYTQSEVQALRTDVANLRATVDALTNALLAIGSAT